MTLLICEMPDPPIDWTPDPFPGSPDAQVQCCTCPEVQPWPVALFLESDCPVHELEKRKPS